MASPSCGISPLPLLSPCLVLTLLSPLFAGHLTQRAFSVAPQSNNHKNISDLLDDLLRGYDNSVRPDFGGPPTIVEVDIVVRSMGPISEVDMTYSMDCYFRQSWVDHRLAFKGNKETLALSISMLKRIWKPDTYFYNGKQSYLHTITTPNKFVRLHQNGRVLYSSRGSWGAMESGEDVVLRQLREDQDQDQEDIESDESSTSGASDTNLPELDRQMAALQDLEDVIQKETYHVIPIMDSRQGFTNLTTSVQRISQTGKEAVNWCRANLSAVEQAKEALELAAAREAELQERVRRQEQLLKEQEQLMEEARMDADSCRAREQDAVQLVEDLRREVNRQRTRAQNALAALADMQAPSEEGQESDLDARRRMVKEQTMAEELSYVKELLRASYNEQDAIARRASFANIRAQQLSDDLAAAHAAHNVDIRLRENLENEMKQLREDAEVHSRELESLQAELDTTRERILQQEKQMRDLALREDRHRKRVEQQQRQVDRQDRQLTALHQELEERRNLEEELRAQMQAAEQELSRQRRQVVLMEEAKDAVSTKLRLMDSRVARLLDEKNSLTSKAQNLHLQLNMVRDEHTVVERRAAQLAARSLDNESKRARLIKLADQQARALRAKQRLWEDLSKEYAVCRKRARQDELAQERLRHDREQLAADLADRGLKLEVAAEEIRLKELELTACKKELVERTSAGLKVGAQLDSMRGKLAAALHELSDQKERTQDTQTRVTMLENANQQIKEEVTSKENQAVQLERLLARARTETHSLRADAQRAGAVSEALRCELAALAQERARLLDGLRAADAQCARLSREAASRLDERDIMATMLMRRNDELQLLRERQRLLEAALSSGRRQLHCTDGDVRLLRIEIRRLRGENRQLSLHLGNLPAVRKELYHALQDLTQSQVRLRALEEEAAVPINFHRWRKLQGSDPTAYELLLKVQTLQKRILRMSSDALHREAQLHRTQHLYLALRRAVCPSEGIPTKHRVSSHARLAARGRHLKAVIAEVAALEALADQKASTRLLGSVRVHKRKMPFDDGDSSLDDGQPQAKQQSPTPSASAVSVA